MESNVQEATYQESQIRNQKSYKLFNSANNKLVRERLIRYNLNEGLSAFRLDEPISLSDRPVKHKDISCQELKTSEFCLNPFKEKIKSRLMSKKTL
jgi:hypothetical protein